MKHGHAKSGRRSPEHRAWTRLRGRCNNPDDPKYYRYGARGIRVCERWDTSFENFLKDMGLRPGPGYSIERKNNDGDYEPHNCVWATRKVQQNNTVRNRFLTYEGKTLTVSQWAEVLGIPVGRINYRLRSGWSVEEVLGRPRLEPGQERFEQRYNAALSEQQVREIRSLCASGVPIPELARMFDVHRTSVRLLVQGKTYKKVK